ncbi:MAG: preprotein translocase subunit YajC [Pirellulales bacterium]|nr:preprotein translocase subunit YajC [Pirellulales bacterium]
MNWQSLSLVLLAENAPQQQVGSGILSMLPMLVMVVLLFYFMILRPQRRDQDARTTMLANLKKNDRVVTAGGLYGVVTNVRPEADEVTLKVDETNNTRVRVTLQSIARKLGDESGDATTEKT